MKKSIFGLAALAAIVLAGCSKNEVKDVNPAIAGTISLAPSTSRAPITFLSTMQAVSSPIVNTDGFKCYGTSAASLALGTPAWYNDGPLNVGGNGIDGTNSHIYQSHSALTWDFFNQVKWPTTVADYPMNFYAWFPQTPAGLTGVVADPTTTPVEIQFNYAVQGGVTFGDPATITTVAAIDPTAQTDMISSAAMANAKPASSSLSMTFNHILTKVNFGVIADPGYDAYVQSVGVANVAKTNDYDVVAQNWPAAPVVGDYTDSYVYANYRNTTGTPAATATAGATLFPTVPANAGTAEPFYTAATVPTAANANLMLMPQDPTATAPVQMWAPPAASVIDASQAPQTLGKSFIYIMYRAEINTSTGLAANPNFIGYANASNDPAWATSPTIGPAGTNYTGPLFVLVGYDYTGSAGGFWKPGFGYIYNIELPGTSGGRLIDDYFYDEFGNRTDLPVVDPADPTNPYPDVPQPILGDEYIHLTPVVTDWNDQTPLVLQ